MLLNTPAYNMPDVGQTLNTASIFVICLLCRSPILPPPLEKVNSHHNGKHCPDRKTLHTHTLLCECVSHLKFKGKNCHDKKSG